MKKIIIVLTGVFALGFFHSTYAATITTYDLEQTSAVSSTTVSNGNDIVQYLNFKNGGTQLYQISGQMNAIYLNANITGFDASITPVVINISSDNTCASFTETPMTLDSDYQDIAPNLWRQYRFVTTSTLTFDSDKCYTISFRSTGNNVSYKTSDATSSYAYGETQANGTSSKALYFQISGSADLTYSDNPDALNTIRLLSPLSGTSSSSPYSWNASSGWFTMNIDYSFASSVAVTDRYIGIYVYPLTPDATNSAWYISKRVFRGGELYGTFSYQSEVPNISSTYELTVTLYDGTSILRYDREYVRFSNTLPDNGVYEDCSADAVFATWTSFFCNFRNLARWFVFPWDSSRDYLLGSFQKLETVPPFSIAADLFTGTKDAIQATEDAASSTLPDITYKSSTVVSFEYNGFTSHFGSSLHTQFFDAQYYMFQLMGILVMAHKIFKFKLT